VERRRSLLQDHAQRQSIELAGSERLFRTAFEHAPAGIAWVDRRGRITDANLALHELLGYPDKALSGRLLSDLTLAEDADIVRQLDPGSESALESGAQVEVRFLRSDTTVIWTLTSRSRVTDAHGARFGLVQVVDITERKAAEARLNDQAMHDPLTGLANRALLDFRITAAMARAGSEDDPGLAVMYIDLDGFKEINDQLGHRAGDEVLIEAAARLERAIRAGDTVARIGGDEFVMLCEGVALDTADFIHQVGLRALDAVSLAGTYNDKTWQVSAQHRHQPLPTRLPQRRDTADRS
jgi:diguanylate cyclase (GGDEF)-like protein/PAS domain S-box-containing protein